MPEHWPKNGKRGKVSWTTKKFVSKSEKNVDVGFYMSQLTHANDENAERMDQYGKPGTSAKARQSDPFMTSYPTSRTRSRFP